MRYYNSILIISLLLATAAIGQELLRNPHLEKHAEQWANWGIKKGLRVESSPEGLRLVASGDGLHQGIAQFIKLKPGYEYEYSCRLKYSLGQNAYVTILSRRYDDTQRSHNLKQGRGKSEWWTHAMKFTVPSGNTGETLLRPVILYGSGEITLEWVSLKEIGKGSRKSVDSASVIPVIKPVQHPEKVIDLSHETPVNVRAHVNEKVSPLPAGCRVENRNGYYFIQYRFSTSGHDAVMFDIRKEIDSCRKIAMEIKSDGKGHRLFMVLTDRSGEAHLTEKPLILNKKKINLDMEIPLPAERPYDILDSNWGGDGNQHLDLPLKSITLVLDDFPDSSRDSGTVIIKNLKIGNW